ncbi:MAG: DUF4331 family protein [Myxococcota bacterium]
MQLKTLWVSALALAAGTAMAADHIDGPTAAAEPTADIADLFAWTSSDASKLNLALTVAPLDSAASFGTAITYVFTVNSSAGYGMAATEAKVMCEFYDENMIECWGPNGAYLEGDASSTSGLSSADGKLKVFAGERNDPFFMEFTGFTDAIGAVVAAGVTPNGTCPAVTPEISGALVGLLTGGGAATDTFAGTNVLGLVVQVDKSLVNSGGPILGVHATTHAKN